LEDYVIANTDGTTSADISPYLKATSGWNSGGNGTDDFGFSALSGGYRNNDGSFNYQVYSGYWWSATELNSDYAWYRNVGNSNDDVYRNNNNKLDGLSLRCLQD